MHTKYKFLSKLERGANPCLAALLPAPIPSSPEGNIHKPFRGLWVFPWSWWCYSLILMPFLTVCSCLCLTMPQLVCPSPQSPCSPSSPGVPHGTLPQTQTHNTSSNPRSWIDSLVKTSMPGALSATGCSRWQEVNTLCLVEDVQQMLWPEDFRFSFLKEQSRTTTFTNSSGYNCATPASIQKLARKLSMLLHSLINSILPSCPLGLNYCRVVKCLLVEESFILPFNRSLTRIPARKPGGTWDAL